MDEEVILELSGIVFELRELGDLESEIALFSDGRYEVLMSPNTDNLTYLPSIVYSWIYRQGILEAPEEIYRYYFDKIYKFLPIINKITSNLSKIDLPGEKEIKILKITSLLI